MGEDGEKFGVRGKVVELADETYKKGVTFADWIKWLKGEAPRPPLKEEEKAPAEVEKPEG